jgi:hypothetical protein
MDFNCVALVLATYENLVRPDRRSKEEPPGTSAYTVRVIVCTNTWYVQQVLHWRKKEPDVCGSAGETEAESTVAAGH